MVDINDLDDSMERRKRELEEAAKKRKYFKVQNANEWMKEADKEIPPNMLFGELWYESEVCILFSDTNLGKSILAVQIANSIASGAATAGLKIEAAAQKVLYFDFELSKKQFQNRYSNNYKDNYQFPDTFLRAELNPHAEFPEDFHNMEEYLNFSIEEAIMEQQVKVLIVDNITYLRNETERSKDALPLMKHLKHLKDKYGISILALAHTPKRDLSKPMTENDLGGSKALMNFCDSSFVIGRSHKNSCLRYVKQIKQRATEEVYGGDNVILCTIEKAHNFLQFVNKGFGSEYHHLKREQEGLSQEQVGRIYKLSDDGMSQRAIAKAENLSVGTINKYLQKRNRS
jgi:RecA-family ATPase